VLLPVLPRPGLRRLVPLVPVTRSKGPPPSAVAGPSRPLDGCEMRRLIVPPSQ
jgi:hypothetical protein